MNNKRHGGMLVWLLMFLLLSVGQAFPAQLPRTTQEILRKLKLDPSILADIDKELQVPGDWIERAKKEGKVRIYGTASPDQAKNLYGTFKERYPFIAVEHSDLGHEARVIKPLVTYRSGRVITDILVGIGGTYYALKAADALEDLRVIPAYRTLPEKGKNPDGTWVAVQRNYYCLAYNRKLVKKEDLPKRWEDFLTNPVWRGGNLALGNRPQLWVLVLWGAHGEKWVKDFLTKLFTELKPQLRKEGITAGVELAGAGEFHAIIPAVAGFTQQRVLAGLPVGFYCPEPVPTAVNEAAILKGSPNVHAARIFLNWLLSKEGQIVQYFARDVTPIRDDLSVPELTPFADQIVGKEAAFRNPELETTVQPKLVEFWNGLWLKGGRP